MKINQFLVKTNIPENLKNLQELATNLWYSWNYEALEIFIRLGYQPDINSGKNYWEGSNQNPVKMLGIIPPQELLEASQDESFVSNLDKVYKQFQEYMKRKSWFTKHFPEDKSFKVAYFSCEYGLDECLPVYSGGLGILSGDHLKSASDLGIPLVGIGLLYQEGYFQQYLNNDGWQQESYIINDWYNMPVSLECNEAGEPLLVAVQLERDTVYCQIWRVQVGRTPLYLLDTNIPQNSTEHREITNRLYGGNRDMRIRQEIVLGIGGIEALNALGIKPSVYHMNEGHSAFLALERIRQLMKEQDLSFHEAQVIVWSSSVFTTHTPVPAGNEMFSQDLIRTYFQDMARDLGLSMDDFIALGQEFPGRSAAFCMTVLALRMAAFCNGVSELHAETSREMWQTLWPELPVEEIPISNITNGIHSMTWTSFRMKELLDRYLGPKFREEPEDPDVWQRIDKIPDNELWRIRQLRRERLITFTRKGLSKQLKSRGASPSEIRYAEEVLNPHALTIGFSRRFASYKRATLLFRDIDRLEAILSNSMRPVQIIFAGKAHPQDNPGKELIREIVKIAATPAFRNHVVFLENYDINVARYLVQGVDIWLNTPRRPLEASGTSGMKAAVNGVLNVSVLDGWWCEGFGDGLGWAIGSGELYDDAKTQDDIESEALYRLLENDIVPLFYERDRVGLPREWIQMMKSSMKKLGSNFNTYRMLVDYTKKLYLPASRSDESLTQNDFQNAKDLAAWQDRIRRDWTQIHLENSSLEKQVDIKVGEQVKITVKVWLGFLQPSDVSVEAYFGPLNENDTIIHGRALPLNHNGNTDGAYIFEGLIPMDYTGRCGYSVRILPKHPLMPHPYTPVLIKWE